MQGSHVEARLHDQDYRREIKDLLAAHFPEAEVYDPLADHAESIRYDEATGRRVFYRHNLMCRSVDVLLAFLPSASMGTAIEMWEAYLHGAVVVAISPMAHNWVVKFTSHAVYADAEEFRAAVTDGRLARRIDEVLSQSTRSSRRRLLRDRRRRRR
jgi:hypothetical protein